jgi:glucokinase
VLRRHERATPTDSQDALLAELVAAVRELRDDDVAAVGFGIPSTIDQLRGRAVSSVNIPLAEVDFRDHMRRALGLPVGIDNDANAAGIAEWQVGAGRGTTDMIILTVGTGLGGGVIANGRPFRGSSGAAAELGHMVIVHDGRPCQGTCTGRGHLEPYVTGVAATKAAQEAFGPSADAHRLVRLAREGDATATAILAEIGRYLGSGMGTLVNAFDPQLIVVGGGFGVAAGEFLLGPAREVLHREALPPGRNSVRVVQAELGTAAGLIGAAFVAFEALDAAT